MDISRVPRRQLEGLYLLDQWITMRLGLPITIINYVQMNRHIYIQTVDPNNSEDHRGWYVMPDGSTQPV
ncbi:MAG: hypothetical protein AB4426_05475 [Xenococcaceae cyanobacterium]